ncbi:PA14 domain-containing protein, partial [Roseovarius sp. CAU 1744]|uniref:PA14 domain-containing protein n=1 Tax=Roseovarius sp. CAU 1744 TaxID=3140368 RepID=UPI00325B5262
MTIFHGGANEILGLRAEYFALPKETISLGAVDFDKEPDIIGKVDELGFYQTNAPFDEGGESDYFAAHFSGNLNVEEGGRYKLFLSSDDVAKLYINGQQVVYNRHSDSDDPRTNSKWVTLDAGSHDIQIYYIENRGSQTLQLEWQGPDSDGQRELISSGNLSHILKNDSFDQNHSGQKDISGLRAEYFALPKETISLGAVDFDEEPDIVGKVDELGFYQTNAPFDEGGESDYFAAHFSGNLNVEEGGRYKLFLSSDDVAKLYINGQQVVYNRHSDSDDPRTNSKWVTLDAGSHDIQIYYIENRGTQTLKLEWQGPDSNGQRELIGSDNLSHIGSNDNHDGHDDGHGHGDDDDHAGHDDGHDHGDDDDHAGHDDGHDHGDDDDHAGHDDGHDHGDDDDHAGHDDGHDHGDDDDHAGHDDGHDHGDDDDHAGHDDGHGGHDHGDDDSYIPLPTHPSEVEAYVIAVKAEADHSAHMDDSQKA